jgi:hypothetical protein
VKEIMRVQDGGCVQGGVLVNTIVNKTVGSEELQKMSRVWGDGKVMRDYGTEKRCADLAVGNFFLGHGGD